ncbi:unnamed protein product [Rotaria sordida]|uniref:Uncharacterized protein n=1 Tax=Rotaria sordida TaxID=392033 RepID=A0A816FAQ8_9BILA|nr:unnamed protein product [Rotaria sordida]CAF1658741.1 unnamed protein product [Rotaria sordida]
MASNSATPNNKTDPGFIIIHDDIQCPPVLKEFFLDLRISIEKNRWSSKCRICSTSITDSYKTTSNFLKHLKNKHQSMLDEWKNNQDQSVKDANQPKIDNIFSPDGEKYSTNNKRQQQLTNSIIQNLIINMGLPLSIVDHISFKNFMNDVDPKYKPVNRRDLTRSFLPGLHKKCTAKLQEICAQSSYVSLTLDVWTDRRMRSYFGVTLHTIINDKYKSFLLSFEQLEGKHTSEKLSAEFDRIIQLYNLNGKIVRLITDNASNNRAAFDDIILPGFEDYFDEIIGDQSESETESNDEESNDYSIGERQQLQTHEVDDSIYQTTLNPISEEEFVRLPCFGHCLQLVVNDGIKASDAALSSLKKVARLAKLAHFSTEFAERLEKVNCAIPRANHTRWNSQFQTVKRVITIPSSTLNSILTDLKKNDLILNSRDRKILEEFVSLFELFDEATVLTQGESYATVTFVAPTVLGILFDLERELSSSTLILSSLCEALISSIKARFSGLLRHFGIDVPFNSFSMSERFSDVIFLIAPLFDARFKLLWLDNLHTVVKIRVLEKIRNAFVRFFSKLSLSMSRNMGADVTNTSESSDIDVLTKSTESHSKRKCLFPYFDEIKKSSVDDKSRILTELDAYLCEESSTANLLFSKKHIYPCLYKLGLKYLSVPATSAPIERVFSKSGFLMRPHRASLSVKNVCLLTFLKCNSVLL